MRDWVRRQIKIPSIFLKAQFGVKSPNISNILTANISGYTVHISHFSLTARVKYCAHFCVAPALIACKRVHAHTNVERRHIMISGAEARRIVRYADARLQSFTLREEARSRPLAALAEYTATSDHRKAPSIGLLRAQTLFFSRDTSASKGAAVRT